MGLEGEIDSLPASGDPALSVGAVAPDLKKGDPTLPPVEVTKSSGPRPQIARSIQGAELKLKKALAFYGAGETEKGKAALESVFSSTGALLKGELSATETIQVRLLRARTFELQAKTVSAHSKASELIAQTEKPDPKALVAELGKTEEKIGGSYANARREIQLAKSAGDPQQQKQLDSIVRNLSVAELRSKHALYSYVVTTQVGYATRAEQRTQLARSKIASANEELQKQHGASSVWSWNGLRERFNGTYGSRELAIKNNNASITTIDEGTKALSPSLKALVESKQNADALAKSGKYGASLQVLKASIAQSAQVATPELADTALKISKVVRPVLLDIGTSVVTNGAQVMAVGSGAGAIAAPVVGIGAGTVAGTGGGAIWNAAEKEVEIFLGRATREEAYKKYREELAANAAEDAKRSGITSVSTVTGTRVGAAAQQLAGGSKIVSGVAAGATQGGTSTVLHSSIELTKATASFLADPKLNVADSKQRLENYKAHLRSHGLTFNEQSKELLISMAAGGAGGAVGAKSSAARTATQSGARKVAVTAAEMGANAGVDVASTFLRGDGALTNEQRYSITASAILGGLTAGHGGSKNSQIGGAHPEPQLPKMPSHSVKPKLEVQVLSPSELPAEVFRVGGVFERKQQDANRGILAQYRMAGVEAKINMLEAGGNGIYLGREVPNMGFENYPEISRRHCAVWKTVDGAFIVRDESRNGTFYRTSANGEWIKLEREMALPPGSELRLLNDGPIVKLGESRPIFPGVTANRNHLIESRISLLSAGSGVPIGRGTAGLALQNNDFVSWHHCSVWKNKAGSFTVQDGDGTKPSTNGTYYFDAKRKDWKQITGVVELPAGTLLRLAKSGPTFVLSASSDTIPQQRQSTGGRAMDVPTAQRYINARDVASSYEHAPELLVRYPEDGPSIASKQPDYFARSNAAAQYFDSVFWQNPGEPVSVSAFRSMNEEMHRVSQYSGKYGQAGVIRSSDRYLSNMRPEAVDYLEKVFERYDKNLKLGTPVDTPAIEGIPREAWPRNDSKVFRGYHRYPNGPELQHYFARGAELYGQIREQILAGRPASEVQRTIGDYYHVMVNARPFDSVNNSMYMNQINYMLRLTGHPGLSHGDTDHLFMRLSTDQARKLWPVVLQNKLGTAKDYGIDQL